MAYFNDDGTEINPDFYPKPGLCLICKKNTDKEEEILCTLNRIDQRESHEFNCGAFDLIDKHWNKTNPES